VVSDLYTRFINPKATDAQQVWLGRISTVVLMFASCALALQMQDALSNFNLMMEVGAGTGLVLILRWFWWRINAQAEIVAMAVSFGMAAFWRFGSAGEVSEARRMVIGVAVTTTASILTAVLTSPTGEDRLRDFYKRVQPGGVGWKRVLEDAEHERVQMHEFEWSRRSDILPGIICTILASIAIWALIFAGGWAIYGRWVQAAMAVVVAAACGWALPGQMSRLRIRD
jgi:Na+/proline symporter